MIKHFMNTILNTEYLPMNDVRTLKIQIIFAFLFLFTILTIPVSFLLNYTFWIKAIFISLFVVSLFLTYIFLKIEKVFLAMQVTIIQAVLFMVFYTQGITSFYAYLLFYIVLTIIALYQEVYSYFVYGTFVTILGVFYIVTQGEGLLLVDDVEGALYIYLVGLILYYLVNFVYILINEKSYAEMNLTWINFKKINDGIQEDIYNYMEAIRRSKGTPALFEDPEFQEAVQEISEFIAKQILKDGSEIKNMVDLYFYIHEVGVKPILNNDDISVNMRKATDSLKKYMINDNSDLFSMIIGFELNDYPSNVSTNDLDFKQITTQKDEQLLVFAFIYVYITHNLYQKSELSQMSESDDMKDIKAYDFDLFFDDTILAFYQDNIDLIKKYLKK